MWWPSSLQLVEIKIQGQTGWKHDISLGFLTILWRNWGQYQSKELYIRLYTGSIPTVSPPFFFLVVRLPTEDPNDELNQNRGFFLNLGNTSTLIGLCCNLSLHIGMGMRRIKLSRVNFCHYKAIFFLKQLKMLFLPRLLDLFSRSDKRIGFKKDEAVTPYKHCQWWPLR